MARYVHRALYTQLSVAHIYSDEVVGPLMDQLLSLESLILLDEDGHYLDVCHLHLAICFLI